MYRPHPLPVSGVLVDPVFDKCITRTSADMWFSPSWLVCKWVSSWWFAESVCAPEGRTDGYRQQHKLNDTEDEWRFTGMKLSHDRCPSVFLPFTWWTDFSTHITTSWLQVTACVATLVSVWKSDLFGVSVQAHWFSGSFHNADLTFLSGDVRPPSGFHITFEPSQTEIHFLNPVVLMRLKNSWKGPIMFNVPPPTTTAPAFICFISDTEIVGSTEHFSRNPPGFRWQGLFIIWNSHFILLLQTYSVRSFYSFCHTGTKEPSGILLPLQVHNIDTPKRHKSKTALIMFLCFCSERFSHYCCFIWKSVWWVYHQSHSCCF